MRAAASARTDEDQYGRVTTRLVALGDSTVEGLMDPGPDDTYVGWADRFAHHLAVREPGLLYANLGVRGQTAHQVRASQLDRALAMEPDIALLVAGVNDVLRPRFDKAVVREDLLTMFRALRDTGARVLTFTMPDMTRVAPLAFALRPRLEHLNDIVREAGRRYDVQVVDLAAEPLAGHPALWDDDRLHANSEGHRRIALALAEQVGLPVDDWRTSPGETAAQGRLRIVTREASWLATHFVPWAWGRLLRHEFATQGRCKRPELTPLDPRLAG